MALSTHEHSSGVCPFLLRKLWIPKVPAGKCKWERLGFLTVVLVSLLCMPDKATHSSHKKQLFALWLFVSVPKVCVPCEKCR